MYLKVKVKLLSHVLLFETPWIVASKSPLSMGFSRQEYWSGLTFPSPGDLPHPGIESGSPTLQADALPSEPQGKPIRLYLCSSIWPLLTNVLYSIEKNDFLHSWVHNEHKFTNCSDLPHSRQILYHLSQLENIGTQGMKISWLRLYRKQWQSSLQNPHFLIPGLFLLYLNVSLKKWY